MGKIWNAIKWALTPQPDYFGEGTGIINPMTASPVTAAAAFEASQHTHTEPYFDLHHVNNIRRKHGKPELSLQQARDAARDHDGGIDTLQQFLVAYAIIGSMQHAVSSAEPDVYTTPPSAATAYMPSVETFTPDPAPVVSVADSTPVSVSTGADIGGSIGGASISVDAGSAI